MSYKDEQKNKEFAREYYLKVTKPKRQAKAKAKREAPLEVREVPHMCPVCKKLWSEFSDRKSLHYLKRCADCVKQYNSDYCKREDVKAHKNAVKREKYATDEEYRNRLKQSRDKWLKNKKK